MNAIQNTMINRYLEYLHAVRGMSPKTITAYSIDLAQFADYCSNLAVPPENAGAACVELFIGDMSLEDKTVLSINRALSSLRGFFRYLVRFNYRPDNPAENLRNRKAPKMSRNFVRMSPVATRSSVSRTVYSSESSSS